MILEFLTSSKAYNDVSETSFLAKGLTHHGGIPKIPSNPWNWSREFPSERSETEVDTQISRYVDKIRV